MNRFIFGVTIALLTLWLAGCSTVAVNSDYDPRADFSQLQRFAWIELKTQSREQPDTATPSLALSSLMHERIQRALTETLQNKGYQQVDSAAAADFLVAYHLNVEDKIDIETIHYHYGYGWWGWPHYGGVGMTSDTRVREYQEGTLLVDLVDPETDQLLWRGSAASRVRDYDTPQEREARIREVVQALLAQFPPEAQ